MAVTSYALSEPRAGAMQRGAVTRMLEDERWLALVLLLPTLALLSLFIAYPFVKGVELCYRNCAFLPQSRSFASLRMTVFRMTVYS